MTEQSVFLEATKKGGCYIVTGKVRKQGRWLNASFTMLAQDMEHMSRAELATFAERRLPECSEDMIYNPNTGEVLV